MTRGRPPTISTLTKKLFVANPVLARRVNVLTKEIVRIDGRGVLRILPARDVAGAHGKTLLVPWD